MRVARPIASSALRAAQLATAQLRAVLVFALLAVGGATLVSVPALIVAPPPAVAASSSSPANIAALQAGLKAVGLYEGRVDGISGPLTRSAIKRLQRKRGLPVNGVARTTTRRALGWRGRPLLGSRVMRLGNRGWDVAALQYLLQRGGFGAGRVDGVFGQLTQQAVVRAQRTASSVIDGLVGTQTLRFLRSGARNGGGGQG
ncbi:MAG TPA: peptidoglycan-binding protein, partial [Solirubrobacterales bacterium]|nr:peptidoglycan-binding protein [Solirubrobacterales bacterium]